MSKLVELGDTDILLIDGDRGENYPRKEDFFEEEHCLFLDAGNISENGFDFTTTHYITKKKDTKLRNGKLQRNDIVMMTRGSVGNVALYDYSIPYENVRINSGMIIIRCQNDFKALSLYYLLKSSFIKKQIKDMMSGSVQKQLPVATIKKIKLPQYNVETPINIVYEIDKKIRNNNLINLEFEYIAKTIYDYWFLQFDFPNEDGKPYKSSGGKMVWNEELKREIPEGWSVLNVKDCIQHINTGLNPRDNFQLGNGNIKYITVKNITTSGGLDFSNCDVIDEDARKIIHKRSDVSKGDILFASIAPLGRCFLVHEQPETWDINESVFSIRPNYQNATSEYLYMFFMSDYFVKVAEHSSTGSVFSGIRVSTLEEMKLIVPPGSMMELFTEQIKTLLYTRYRNEKENQELASLRDFLLPLLMNGQVGFKE